MRRFIRLILIALSLVIFGTFGMLVKNYEFEAGESALKAGDYSAALIKLKSLASLGDHRSQFLVGQMYAFGFGVPKDDATAIYWFRKAAILAELGADPAAPAELSVSKSYSQGLGVKADAKESLKWLQRAASGGSKEAALQLQQIEGH